MDMYQATTKDKDDHLWTSNGCKSYKGTLYNDTCVIKCPERSWKSHEGAAYSKVCWFHGSKYNDPEGFSKFRAGCAKNSGVVEHGPNGREGGFYCRYGPTLNGLGLDNKMNLYTNGTAYVSLNL